LQVFDVLLACRTDALLLGTLMMLARTGEAASCPTLPASPASGGHGTRECSGHGRSSTDDTPATRARDNCRRLSATRVMLTKATTSCFGMLPAFSSSRKTSSAVCGAKTTLLRHWNLQTQSLVLAENRETLQCRIPSSAQPQRYWPSHLRQPLCRRGHFNLRQIPS